MSPLIGFLVSAGLVCFIVMAVLVILAACKYLASSGKAAIITVESESKDNAWTVSAAQSAGWSAQNVAKIEADARIDAAKLNAQAAADNRAAEEARLERVRLELGKPKGTVAGLFGLEGDDTHH